MTGSAVPLYYYPGDPYLAAAGPPMGGGFKKPLYPYPQHYNNYSPPPTMVPAYYSPPQTPYRPLSPPKPQQQPPVRQEPSLPAGSPGFTGSPPVPLALQRQLAALDKKARERTRIMRQHQQNNTPVLAAAPASPPLPSISPSPQENNLMAPLSPSPVVVISDQPNDQGAFLSAPSTRTLPLTQDDCSLMYPRAASNWSLKVDAHQHRGYLCIPLREANQANRTLAIQVYPSLPGVMAALEASEELVAFLGMVSTVVDLPKMGEKAKHAMVGVMA